MTFDIPKERWAEFLNDFSRRRYGWETKVEIISDSIGDQILSNGLALKGVTFENRAGRSEIEILIGVCDAHQTHTIHEPVAVCYLDEESGFRGMLEIEEANGTKTLLSLVDPMPVYIGYTAFKIVAAS
ncbi:MAG: DUF5335 family protein [Acidobacteria bacterium]|nr:DUF5335 family protein [Acidobacteriota bacterium]